MGRFWHDFFEILGQNAKKTKTAKNACQNKTSITNPPRVGGNTAPPICPVLLWPHGRQVAEILPNHTTSAAWIFSYQSSIPIRKNLGTIGLTRPKVAFQHFCVFSLFFAPSVRPSNVRSSVCPTSDPPQLRVATRVSLIFRIRCQDTTSDYNTIQQSLSVHRLSLS